ncbi:MAG: NAD-dependent epimerase/dehydratase family protein [Opitutaceae bacterium]|jgi:UDP-glucuronate 4-epimerase
MKVLVTGAAGFIGYHTARRLAATGGCEVLGLDNLNDYYPVDLKRARLQELAAFPAFRFVEADFADAARFREIYLQFQPDYVIHLGAQAGVRYSMENPAAYTHSNLIGFASVLEAARVRPPRHLVYASSSSVYGGGAVTPFAENQPTDHPLSFYAATKKSNEVTAYSYAHLFGLPLTGLRFFTVYGPWGRPDMAPILFSKAISEGKPIKLFNHGNNRRDFTYIDDIVDGVLAAMRTPPAADASTPPARVFNLGHNHPVEVVDFVRKLESLLGRTAKIELVGPQPGDMVETCADLTRVQAALGYSPRTPLSEGLRSFVEWFKMYYR